MVSETWKDIPGYEGLYQVSDLGRVKGLAKTDTLGRRRKEQLLKKSVGHKGYERLVLYKDGESKATTVHRLVVSAFLKTLPPGMKVLQVNHKNGVKNDNRLDNLEIVTPKENAEHARTHGLTESYAKGSKNRQARPVICFKGEKPIFMFGSIVDAELGTGILKQNISDNVRGNRRSAGGYVWRYL